MVEATCPKLRLCNDNVLIHLDPESEKIAYLEEKGVELYKPQGANEHVYRTGTVVAVGPGCWAKKVNRRELMAARPGMRVMFVKFVATHTQSARSIQAIVGKDHAIIKDHDILLDIGSMPPSAIER